MRHNRVAQRNMGISQVTTIKHLHRIILLYP